MKPTVQETTSENSRELELMGCSQTSQPNKKQKQSNGSANAVFNSSDQTIWCNKWLKFRNHVLKNPIELSIDEDHHAYSEKIILYLHEYRSIDPQFAELAIKLLTMLPSSSASEHLFSIATFQLKPNMSFETLACRTVIASNAGFLINNVINISER